MSVSEREIVKQAPTHPGMQTAADDRWMARWVFNMGAPISLAEYSGSRFVGKFDNEVLPSKKPVLFAPHMARSLGVYEHRAHIGDLGSMSTSVVDEMLSVPINAPQIGSIDLTRQAPLSQYDNNPKLCAYLLMRDYERRGLVLFEDLRGVEEEEFNFLFSLIIPPEIEEQWARTTRTVLDHEFRGPFLDQYKAYMGVEGNAILRTAVNARLKAAYPDGAGRKITERLSVMGKQIRGGVNRAWSYENSVLNTTEQQIRRYRNGHKGKEFYDMPDERISNPVPPLDLHCLADTGRSPIDLQQVEATNKASEATQNGMVAAMETLGEKIAQKMAPGVTPEQIEGIIERRLAAQRAEWESEKAEWDRKISELQAAKETPSN